MCAAIAPHVRLKLRASRPLALLCHAVLLLPVDGDRRSRVANTQATLNGPPIRLNEEEPRTEHSSHAALAHALPNVQTAKVLPAHGRLCCDRGRPAHVCGTPAHSRRPPEGRLALTGLSSGAGGGAGRGRARRRPDGGSRCATAGAMAEPDAFSSIKWSPDLAGPRAYRRGGKRRTADAGVRATTNRRPHAGAAYPITIAARMFPARRITVEPKFVDPPAGELPRIEAERKAVEAIFAHPTRERFWSQPFIVPVPGAATSSFGAAPSSTASHEASTPEPTFRRRPARRSWRRTAAGSRSPRTSTSLAGRSSSTTASACTPTSPTFQSFCRSGRSTRRAGPADWRSQARLAASPDRTSIGRCGSGSAESIRCR